MPLSPREVGAGSTCDWAARFLAPAASRSLRRSEYRLPRLERRDERPTLAEQGRDLPVANDPLGQHRALSAVLLSERCQLLRSRVPEFLFGDFTFRDADKFE